MRKLFQLNGITLSKLTKDTAIACLVSFMASAVTATVFEIRLDNLISFGLGTFFTILVILWFLHRNDIPVISIIIAGKTTNDNDKAGEDAPKQT